MKNKKIENKDCSEIIATLSDSDKVKIASDTPYGLIDTVRYAINNHDKKFIGAELDKKYFKIANKRINKKP